MSDKINIDHVSIIKVLNEMVKFDGWYIKYNDIVMITYEPYDDDDEDGCTCITLKIETISEIYEVYIVTSANVYILDEDKRTYKMVEGNEPIKELVIDIRGKLPENVLTRENVEPVYLSNTSAFEVELELPELDIEICKVRVSRKTIGFDTPFSNTKIFEQLDGKIRTSLTFTHKRSGKVIKVDKVYELYSISYHKDKETFWVELS